VSNIETQATTENTGYVTLEMLQAMSKQSIFRRTTIARPRSFASNHSDATEILDTDFESDCDRLYDDDSSRKSAGSVSLDPIYVYVQWLTHDIVGGR
jgi:hypothetical protein